MALSARKLLDECADLAVGNRAHEPVDRLAILECVNRGDRLDAQLARDLLVFVDVDLDQFHGAVGIGDGLLECGAELLAGSAPGRPKVDDDRHLARGFQHVGGEGFQIAVLDVRTAGGRRGRLVGGFRRRNRSASGANQCHGTRFLISGSKDGRWRPERKGPAPEAAGNWP